MYHKKSAKKSFDVPTDFLTEIIFRTPLYPSTAFETTHHENTEHLKSRVCKINVKDHKSM